MKALTQLLFNLLPMVINMVIESVSPELRTMLVNFVKSLRSKAEKTANPFDDLAVSALEKILEEWIK